MIFMDLLLIFKIYIFPAAPPNTLNNL